MTSTQITTKMNGLKSAENIEVKTGLKYKIDLPFTDFNMGEKPTKMMSVVSQTEQILMGKGLYRDVISIIQSFLMPSKDICEGYKLKMMIEFKSRVFDRPSDLSYYPFEEALQHLWGMDLIHRDYCFRPPIKDLIYKLDYLSRVRIEFLYKKCKNLMSNISSTNLIKMRSMLCRRYNIRNKNDVFEEIFKYWNKEKYTYVEERTYMSPRGNKIRYNRFRRWLGDRETQYIHQKVMYDIKKKNVYDTEKNRKKYIMKRIDDVDVYNGWKMDRMIKEDWGRINDYKNYMNNSASVVLYFGRNQKSTYRNCYVDMELWGHTFKLKFYRLKNKKGWIFIPFTNYCMYIGSKMTNSVKNNMRSNVYDFVVRMTS